jgi:hypothetical protein
MSAGPLLFMLLGAVLCDKPASAKQIYTIGGWNQRGNSEKFLQEWTPLLADYLTSVVGLLYDPPISFQLVPIDWDENKTAEILIPEGKLDFICKLSEHSSFITFGIMLLHNFLR